jgi:carbon starvation protein
MALGAFAAFFVAYRTYGRFLARRIYRIKKDNPTPAHNQRDDMDYVPTRREILFGHHYTSIAGTGPIVGPALAVIWGWLPAFLWVVFGSIFLGAVKDFGSLVLSVRNRGRSIGDIASDLINPRVRTLFLLIVFFALWIVIAIFGWVIGSVFKMYPQSVFPVWMEVPIALWLGHMVYRRGKNPFRLGLVAVGLMYVTVVIGAWFPIDVSSIFGGYTLTFWIVVFLIYAYIASTLPVWRLLQPRDYINGHELFIALGLLTLGVLIAHPKIVAPVVNLHPQGAPPIIPMMFVVVACGAISGFHSLVGSGTSSKQLDKETDAQLVGYGSMLLEGVLAVLVLVAVAAGLGGEWPSRYASWATAQGLGAKIGAFVDGSAKMVTALGIPPGIALTIMGVFVASFASTTLDTATRIQRYVVTELALAYKVKVLTRRHPATIVAVGTAAGLALWQLFQGVGGGGGAIILWPLFGTVNQLLAGLALLIITLYLLRRGTPARYTAIPMVFMLLITGWAMIYNLVGFHTQRNWLLLVMGGVIFILEIWLVLEAYFVFRRKRPVKEEAP